MAKATRRNGIPLQEVILYSLKLSRQFLSAKYYSPKAIRMIENLGRRTKAMQIEPLIPISDEQSRNFFESWEDFRYWLMFYNVTALDV